MKCFWFSNVNYIDVKQGICKKANIKIEDGKIVKITDELNERNCVIIDGSDKYLCPGLVDMHVHIVWDGSATPVETMVNEGNYVACLRGLDNAQKSLENGITMIREVGSPDDTAIHLAHAIDRKIVNGARIVPCGRAIQCTGGHVPTIGYIADTKDEILKAIRYLKSIGAQWIKVMATGGAYGPEEVGPVLFSEEELELIVKESHRLNLKVSAHALSKVGINNCVEAGIDTIEHGAQISPEYLHMMKDKGLVYIPTLSIYKELADSSDCLPEHIVKKAEWVVENQKETFKNAMIIGVKIALGTDAGSPNFGDHPSVLKEMLVMHEYGMSIADVIKSATISAAEVLRKDNLFGSIEEGKIADLVLLNSNPLNNLKAFADINSVYQEGNLVVRRER